MAWAFHWAWVQQLWKLNWKLNKMAKHIHIHMHNRKTLDAGSTTHVSFQTYEGYAFDIYKGEFPLGYFIEISKNGRKIKTTEKVPSLNTAIKNAEGYVNRLIR